MSIFGWSLPPGVTSRMIDEAMGCEGPCEVCGSPVDDCICPECPVCHVTGDPQCYERVTETMYRKDHGLVRTLEQDHGLALLEETSRQECAADAAYAEDCERERCSNPKGHVWNRSAAEADEARLSGDYANDNIRCVYCGADAYAAQCLMCKHQRSRGTHVTGCLRFEETRLEADVVAVLTGLLFQNAGRHPCPGLEKLEFGPDAYRSIDLPERA